MSLGFYMMSSRTFAIIFMTVKNSLPGYYVLLKEIEMIA